MKSRRTSLEAGIDRLLDLVANGHLASADTQFARKHSELARQLAQVKADIVMFERQLVNSDRTITPERINRFGDLMRLRLRTGEPALRQYYVRSIVAQIEVGDGEIRISGQTRALEHAIGRTDDRRIGQAPNIERKWCARQDSNLRPQA